jgi:hypothetical protein
MTSSPSNPETISSLHKPKAKWSRQEDEVLCQQVEEHGAANWNALALALPGRTGKQCRERWISRLSPELSAEVWTPDEDNVLVSLQQEYGNGWAKFRGSLPHRSTVSIKNRWVSLKRKQNRTGRAIVPRSPVFAISGLLVEDSVVATVGLPVEPAAFQYNTFEAIAFDDAFFGDFNCSL